jgi:hypothetical protein
MVRMEETEMKMKGKERKLERRAKIDKEVRGKTPEMWKKRAAEKELDQRIENPIQKGERLLGVCPRKEYANSRWRYSGGN